MVPEQLPELEVVYRLTVAPRENISDANWLGTLPMTNMTTVFWDIQLFSSSM